MDGQAIISKALDAVTKPSDLIHVSLQSLRSSSLTSTIKRVLRYKQHLGITRISEITELDNIGIPVISTIRPKVDSAQITATQGKGLTVKIALASALMEAVERSAAANYRKIISDTARNLFKKNKLVLTPIMLGGIVDENSQCDWVISRDFYGDREVFIPAAEVLFPFYPSNNSTRPFKPSTTGIASGNTILEALLSSVNEVVERYTTSCFNKTLNAFLIKKSSIYCSEIQSILNRFEHANVEVSIFDLSHLSTLPTFYVSCLSSDARNLDIACAGQASHLFPEIALKRALLEAAQSRAVAIQGSREDLIRHATEWKGSFDYFKQKREKLISHVVKNYGTKLWEMKKSTQPTSTYDLVMMTLIRLYQHNYKHIIVSYLTDEIVGIPVTHVIIPGMIDTIIEPKRTMHNTQMIESILEASIDGV